MAHSGACVRNPKSRTSDAARRGATASRRAQAARHDDEVVTRRTRLSEETFWQTITIGKRTFRIKRTVSIKQLEKERLQSYALPSGII